MPSQVYRITDAAAWAEAERGGQLPLSPLDRRDGYVHLSTADQVPGTLARYYAGRDDLVLLTIAVARLTGALRYESPSGSADRVDELFPHYYGGPLPVAAVIRADRLARADDGHLLPPHLRRELLDDAVELDVAWDEQP